MSLVSKRGVVYCERPALPCPTLHFPDSLFSNPNSPRGKEALLHE
jgi:hypothetical protein